MLKQNIVNVDVIVGRGEARNQITFLIKTAEQQVPPRDSKTGEIAVLALEAALDPRIASWMVEEKLRDVRNGEVVIKHLYRPPEFRHDYEEPIAEDPTEELDLLFLFNCADAVGFRQKAFRALLTDSQSAFYNQMVQYPREQDQGRDQVLASLAQLLQSNHID